MPNIKDIEAALTLSEDKSKLLGLTLGKQQVTPGQFIPKEGK